MFKEKESFNSHLISLKNPQSVTSEEFKSIRSNIQFSMIDSHFSSISVTSSEPGEGKSFVSTNIAIVFATQGLNVLLVDTDLRKPSLYRLFQVTNKKGTTTLLRHPHIPLEKVIYPTSQENLSFLPSGPIPPNPSELLNSSRMEHLMDKLREVYDLVIYDLPPIVTVTDAQVMAGKTDGTIFVVRNGVTERASMRKAKHLLEHANANVIGTVFNGRKRKKRNRDYAYY